MHSWQGRGVKENVISPEETCQRIAISGRGFSWRLLGLPWYRTRETAASNHRHPCLFPTDMYLYQPLSVNQRVQ